MRCGNDECGSGGDGGSGGQNMGRLISLIGELASPAILRCHGGLLWVVSLCVCRDSVGSSFMMMVDIQ